MDNRLRVLLEHFHSCCRLLVAGHVYVHPEKAIADGYSVALAAQARTSEGAGMTGMRERSTLQGGTLLTETEVQANG